MLSLHFSRLGSTDADIWLDGIGEDLAMVGVCRDLMTFTVPICALGPL